MEQIKLEKEIRQKLSVREITPSINAWDKMDSMLGKETDIQHKGNYNWLYTAASIIGFLLIGTVFFSQTEALIDLKREDIVIVNKNSVSPLEENIKIPRVNQSGNSLVVTKVKKTMLNLEDKNLVESDTLKSATKGISESEIETKNSNRLIANLVSHETIDELLTSAVVDNNDKIENEKSRLNVDAANLLSQVDGELELSFREKVVQKLGENYKIIKVALNNRNQE
jgi:hypothetical protein